jgi:hypothetical protein
MLARLEKIDPQFRKLTDQLFFTDREDIDLTSYETLWGDNPDHTSYLWDRLYRAMEMFWEESFWINRFNFLFDVVDKKNLDQIEAHVISGFSRLITHNYGASPKFNNEYIQFIAWCKVKSSRKENITPLRDFLLLLPNSLYADRLKEVVSNFTPYLFNDINEYVGILSKRVGQSARNFQLIKHLEQQGLPVDKSAINKLCQDLLFKRVPNRKNRRSFFAMIEDASVMAHIKSEYKPEHRDRLVAFVKACDYKEIEEYHLRNIGSLLSLDTSIADDLLNTYADRLYARGTGDKGANIKRLIRACKAYPQFSPKKVLVYLSANNRMADIKKLVASFHDLKTLVPFI